MVTRPDSVAPLQESKHSPSLSWNVAHIQEPFLGKQENNTTLCTQQGQFLAYNYPKSTQNTVQPRYGRETSESSSASSRNSEPRILTYTLDFDLTTAISSTPLPSNHVKRNSRGEKHFDKGVSNPLAYSPNSNIPALSSQVCADHELRFTAPRITTPSDN